MRDKWSGFVVFLTPWLIVALAYVANPKMGVWIKANPYWATALAAVLFLVSAGTAFYVALDPDGGGDRPRGSHGGCNCHGHDGHH